MNNEKKYTICLKVETLNCTLYDAAREMQHLADLTGCMVGGEYSGALIFAKPGHLWTEMVDQFQKYYPHLENKKK